jgi:hypothetical protein
MIFCNLSEGIGIGLSFGMKHLNSAVNNRLYCVIILSILCNDLEGDQAIRV